jgi:hypothetical protein
MKVRLQVSWTRVRVEWVSEVVASVVVVPDTVGLALFRVVLG